MMPSIKMLPQRIFTLFPRIFRPAPQQADHKKLTHYLVALGRQTSETKIISQAAVCLKDIIHYRMFAFALKNETGIDFWLDPGICGQSMKNRILSDFNIKNPEKITGINHSFFPDEPAHAFDMDDLICFEQDEEDCCYKIYLLPESPRRSFHNDLIDLILQGCCTALSRQAKIQRLRNAAVIDPLTGCYNRREFENQLKRSIAGAVRHNASLSVFIFDLDHFKHINDTYGHLAGDEVLRHVVRLVQQNMRTGDILARYGGEEFIAILPETNKQKAMELADRLRQKIFNTIIKFNDQIIKISASFGVAEHDRRFEMTRIIQDADTMLYKAKVSGRNAVMPGLIKILSPRSHAGAAN